VGNSDPRDFIVAESQRIPFKAALSPPPNSAHPRARWYAASTVAAPLMRRKGVAPIRVGGNDHRFLFSDSSLIFFLF
jgi:hypothetical protein